MKAEISQIRPDGELHFSGVYQQQGRMLVDRDWNELCDILRRLGTEIGSEAIGTGVPRHDGMLSSPTPPDGTLTLKNEGGLVAADGLIGHVLPRANPADPIYPNQLDLPENVRVPPTRAAAPAASLGPRAVTRAKQTRVSKALGAAVLARELPIRAAAAAATPLLKDSPNSKWLYVDLWERTVTAFEDGDLIDPALHGADTCFRTQRMAQIKAAAEEDLDKSADPCLPAFLPKRIPAKGNAEFNAVLTKASEDGDKCDPCADNVTITRAVTNRLFRLEVHSVTFDTSRRPSRIKLKWSGDNGAREFRADEFATAANPAKYSYEFFNDATERLLGMPSDDWQDEALLRGELDPANPDQAAAVLPRVREWDGWCELTLGGAAWSVAGGRYAGKALDGANASVSASGLAITLSDTGLQFSLTLGGKNFLAGDYWLALLRTRAPSKPVDLRLRVMTTQPFGIQHHYCILGVATVTGKGIRFEKLWPHDLRRLQHPSLTCIDASDIGFAKPCNTSVYSQPAAANIHTVADALKLLCNVTAEQILFSDPGCDYLARATPRPANVKMALDALCKQPADTIPFILDRATCDYLAGQLKDREQQNVAAALNALCKQPAETIPFKPDCSYLKGADNVADALNALCKQPAESIPFTPGCSYLKGTNNVAAALNALCARGDKAILPRIKSVKWSNDGTLTFSEFQAGLHIVFSDAMLASISYGNVFIVTWELPFNLLRFLTGNAEELDDFLTPQVVTGATKVAGNTITFVPRMKISVGTFTKLQAMVAQRELGFPGIRCRVRLMGRSIFADDGKRLLDGFVPMKPTPASAAGATRMDLDFDNAGLGEPSDFESWFYLIAPTPPPPPPPPPPPQDRR